MLRELSYLPCRGRQRGDRSYLVQYLLPKEPLLVVRVCVCAHRVGAIDESSLSCRQKPRKPRWTTSWLLPGTLWRGVYLASLDHGFQMKWPIFFSFPAASVEFSHVLEGTVDRAFSQLRHSLVESYHSAAQR